MYVRSGYLCETFAQHVAEDHRVQGVEVDSGSLAKLRHLFLFGHLRSKAIHEKRRGAADATETDGTTLSAHMRCQLSQTRSPMKHEFTIRRLTLPIPHFLTLLAAYAVDSDHSRFTPRGMFVQMFHDWVIAVSLAMVLLAVFALSTNRGMQKSDQRV